VRVLIALGLGLAGAYALHAATGWGGSALDGVFVDWVYDGIAAIATALCAWRAIRIPDDRVMWSLIALAFVLEATGNTVDTALYGTSNAPVPSVADAFWAAFYVPMILALAFRVRAAASVAGAVIIDILIAACALGSVSAAFVLEAILSGGSGSTAEFVTTLAYPVADLVLATLVVQLAAASGWRLGRATGLMGACFAVWVGTDTVYAFEIARGTYVAGGILDIGWVLPYALFGVAAWMRPDPAAVAREVPGWRALAVPVCFAVIALAIVVYSGVARVNLVAVGLGTGALLLVIARFIVTFRSYLAALGNTRLILETAHDAFISFDASGRITDWNPQAQASLGWSRQEVLGRDLAETILPEDRRDAHRLSMERFLATGERDVLGRSIEQPVRHRQGHEFPADWTISPLATDGGYTFNVFLRDITERRRAQEELAVARDEALEASRMKSMFVANVSHEIRTPMNGVIGMGDLLLGTELDAQQREFAETISSSGEALLAIIDDILDVSKIEAGKLVLDPTDFDLGEAIERACGLLAGRAHEQGIELLIEIETDLPPLVHGDEGRIRQVVTNLVANAIKFTSEGEVLVRASLDPARGEEEEVRLRLEVSDTGVGIEPEALARLFKPFSQADASTTRRYGGTGLGLAISRQLIELMGGRIDAESEAGRGSRFWFELPLSRVPSAGDVATGDDLGPAGLRALVVDGNATSRGILARQLRARQLGCEVAGSAAAAIELVDAAVAAGLPYGLALIDLGMPDGEGSALARAIRARSDAGAMRLVSLTRMTGRAPAPAEAVRCFDGSLGKPVRRSRLYAEIQAAAGPEHPPVGRREPPPAAETWDRPGPSQCILVVEDTLVNQVVAARMLERCGFRSQIAANGREALEALELSSFAATLMDCQMPELDGYETTREIRRREGGAQRMPIIAMTANSMEGERDRCLAAGMDDYLTKPLRNRALKDALARATPVPVPVPVAGSTGPT
jgi:PAS domain S-box-containing protein